MNIYMTQIQTDPIKENKRTILVLLKVHSKLSTNHNHNPQVAKNPLTTLHLNKTTRGCIKDAGHINNAKRPPHLPESDERLSLCFGGTESGD